MKTQSSAQRISASAPPSRGLDGPGNSCLARRTIPEQRETTGPHHQRVYDSIVDLIANTDNPTPMVKLSERYNAEPDFDPCLRVIRRVQMTDYQASTTAN